MRTIKLGIKALIRSPLRGGLLVGVLGVSIGLALIMITVNGAFAQRLDDIRAQVGTDITVRPAGTFGGAFGGGGGGGGGAPGGNTAPTATPSTSSGSSTPASTQPILTDTNLQQLTSIPNISGITTEITERYRGTTLKAATLTGSNGQPATGPNGQAFSPPITVTGTDDPSTLVSLGATDTTISSGRTLTSADAGTDVAVVGTALATANNLSVGSTFTMTNTDSTGTATGATTTLTAVGIYTTGTSFADNGLAIPIDTARAIFGRSNEVDQAIVKANRVDNVNQVATDIKNALGTNAVDVTTAQSSFSSISAPLSDAKSSSEVGMYAALLASAIIILFSIGLVARQRIREIGILKAVGASNWNVVSQFAFETGAIAVGAALVGAIATFPLAQIVANGLVSSPAAATGSGGVAGAAGRGAGRFAIAGNPVSTARGLLGSVNVAVSPEVFLYALAIAVSLALLATVVPAWYVGRVRPAEVLRHE
jgi:putative ABC transport system permease protein